MKPEPETELISVQFPFSREKLEAIRRATGARSISQLLAWVFTNLSEWRREELAEQFEPKQAAPKSS
jgi:hypothetical protein